LLSQNICSFLHAKIPIQKAYLMQLNHATSLGIAIIVWIFALALRPGLPRSREPRGKGIFRGYLGLTFLQSIGLCIFAFDPSLASPTHSAWLGYMDTWVIAWIPVSTFAMYMLPLRLILIPNAYIVAWIIYVAGSIGSIDAGNEPSYPHFETLLFGVFLFSGSIVSLFCLKRWWLEAERAAEKGL
jgi:hypothetical protein